MIPKFLIKRMSRDRSFLCENIKENLKTGNVINYFLIPFTGKETDRGCFRAVVILMRYIIKEVF
ncbi:hypothetical protein BDD43_4842 [Mucilaginibacter gracilis]|uniref:Uncharacterized protein n=1 Tax=Mucilaginibacter gracilis TaxID=423350 RepID=A0A495J6H3_9SPHI|nr:hypothetical protein BDD43_4842 [Mucilaginibacter gracilis]